MQKFPKSTKKTRSGFTLVEMLVVIAVIGLLAALLFPALARVRESGKTKVCLSNMKQLGLAFQQYVQDNGRRYPGAGAFQTWGNGGQWVAGTNGSPLADLATYAPTGSTASVETGALYPYVRSTASYICPSNSDGKIKHLTYSMNCALEFMSDVRITQPTDIIVLVDEDKCNDGYFYAVPANDNPRSTDALTQLHNGGGNLLFADGHAKFYRMDSYTLAANNDPTYGPQSIINKKLGMAKTDVMPSGTPRFHDPQFGVMGSYLRVPSSHLDTCNVATP